MKKDTARKEAENIVEGWFANTGAEAVSRSDILKKVTESTFYNYMVLLNKYNLAKAVKDDPKDRRKTTKVELTDKGKQVLARKSRPAVAISNYMESDLGYAPIQPPKKSLDDLFKLADTLEAQDPKLTIHISAVWKDQSMEQK